MLNIERASVSTGSQDDLLILFIFLQVHQQGGDVCVGGGWGVCMDVCA